MKMLSMNELVELRMQQQLAHELYRQQIMQRIPDPFTSMLPFHMSPHMIVPQRPTLPGVKAKLENDELWKEFHKIGTEMIITKSGRRMFPSMRVSLSGLEDDSNYCVLLEMVPIGDCRYKFSGSHWIPAGGAEPQSPQRMFLHPDSPSTGAHWQSQPILFNKVKLTNNTLDNNGHIVLASMHKYQPRLHIIRSSDLTQLPWAPQQAFIFPETEFVAVTAYQNDRITKLKIDNNPFAKGFRETGQSRCKRKLGVLNSDERSGCENPPSPSKSSLSSNEDDRISVLSDQSGSPLNVKRARSSSSCDDENYLPTSISNSFGNFSPYYDEAMYSAMAMYQRENCQQQQQQQQLLSPSPLDIAAATYFASRTNLNINVPPMNEMPPLLRQLPHYPHPQSHFAPIHLPPHHPMQIASSKTLTTPNNSERITATTVSQPVEEQNVVNSSVSLSDSISKHNESTDEPKQSKRNNFSISAILAF